MTKKPFYSVQHSLPAVEHPFSGPLGEHIDDLNNRFTIVKNGAKKFAFNHEQQRFFFANSVQVHQSSSHYWNGKKYNSAQLWYKEYHRYYDRMVFVPGETPVMDGAFNEWQGWDCKLIESHEVNWSIVNEILGFLESWVCQYKKETCIDLISFMARLIQNPAEHEERFILIEQDKHGLRSIIMELMESLMPWHYSIRLHETNNLGSKFSQLTDKRLLTYFYEVGWTERAKLTAKLESMIKSPMFEDQRHYNRFVISAYDYIQLPKPFKNHAINIMCNRQQDAYYAIDYIKEIMHKPGARDSWAYFLYHFE